MEMTYGGNLVMPSKCVVMNSKEMEYVEGGAVLETILAVISICGAGYGAGYAAGKRVAHKGITKSQYSKVKWPVRAAVIGAFGIFGGVTMCGFENGFYDTVKK